MRSCAYSEDLKFAIQIIIRQNTTTTEKKRNMKNKFSNAYHRLAVMIMVLVYMYRTDLFFSATITVRPGVCLRKRVITN